MGGGTQLRIENMKTSMKRALLGTTAVAGLGLLSPAPTFPAEPVLVSHMEVLM